jgi:tetratricopeptide (TPR) repeat protein
MSETRIESGPLIQQLGLNDKLIQSKKRSAKRGQYRAAFNWLKFSHQNTTVVVENESSDARKVQGFLEAIHHLCEAQDYAASTQILKAQIGSPISKVSDMALHSYLLYKGQGRQLIESINMILEGLQNEDSLYFLRILKAAAAESLGQRRLAVEIYEDICEKKSPQSKEYLEALARLACCQIQMGQYQAGVPNLHKALSFIKEMEENDSTPLLSELKIDLMEGLAFYRMNTGSFDEAFNLFGKALRLREQKGLATELVRPLTHQGIILRKSAIPRQHLLKILMVNMLRLVGLRGLANVFYRKLCEPLKLSIDQSYERAEHLLRRAHGICKESENENAISWIDHHLAWVIINRGQASLAEEQALKALYRYEAIEDQRGVSDCHEQLGRIYLTKNKFCLEAAEISFNQSLSIRENIESLHGIASSTLNLSFLYWHKGKRLQSLHFLVKATRAYHKSGILNLNRIFGILLLFSVWTVGERDWTA